MKCNKKKIYILVGPSGSGKDTLGDAFREIGIPELVSHTTRKMRKGEVNGESYHFVDKDEFDTIDRVEYSEYAGNYYCLSRDEVSGKLKEYDAVFAITDVHGMEQVKEIYPDETVSIFIKVTLEEMVERMVKRGDKVENIGERIVNAVKNKELLNGAYCDYVIRNENIEVAISSLLAIVGTEDLNKQTA